VSIPPDWIASEFVAEGEGLWFKGDPLRSEVSFSLLRYTPLAELSRGGTVKTQGKATVAGVAAERYAIETTDPDRLEKGVVVVFPRVGPGGSTALAGFAAAEKWDQYEKTIEQIIACVRVGGPNAAKGKGKD
jgi:hypothetical protein